LINNVDVAILNDPAGDQGCAGAPGRRSRALGRNDAENGADGVTQVIECAPSKTLIGMAKRIDPVLVGEALVDQAALERVLATIKAPERKHT
jgi:[acyl-carrier-protein] S-malonyltransferase